ncbi:MAG: DUF3300 domain-containing protein [Methylovulum sp.]
MISKLATSTRRPSGVKLRHVMLAALITQAVGCGGQDNNESKQTAKSQPPTTQIAQQSPPAAPVTPAVPPPEAKPLNTIESLVAPIALYPDPLLAEVLVASTYPLEVVQAARWLESKPDPNTVKSKNWDASIMRITAVPSVVSMMSEHLDWTTQLGDTFLAQPKEVMDAVQTLRKRASDAGFLKDSDLQKVTKETVSSPEAAPAEEGGSELKATPAVLTREIITIQPAKEDTISVPSYNPEVVYAAPLAAPPATTASYTAASPSYPATAPASGYYPSYYPAPAATTTSSSSDQLLTFGAGAVVGGLLTWGIMEWADDDDDWDDDYHVVHHYGNSVCHSGNCWHGGGYYGGSGYNRGVINSGDINVSGNEININRDGTFKPEQLQSFKDRGGAWKPDPRHRRGQAYPALAENRLGKIQQPALPGNRLGNAQAMPANLRGYGAGTPTTRPAQARLSSADIQQQLKTKPRNESIRRPSAKDAKPAIASRENALESLRSSEQGLKLEKGRGAASMNRASAKKTSPAVTKRSAIPASKTLSQRGASSAKQQARIKETRASTSQRIESQRRFETSRPSAFEGANNASQAKQFSQRGAASRERFQPTPSSTRNIQKPTSGGGGMKQRERAPSGVARQRERPSSGGGGARQRGGGR